jgi:lysophospholipase L1-like esterase
MPMRILLVGDSTVTEDEGWGSGFRARLAPDAECVNHARGGRSSKSYREEGHWRAALSTGARYVLVQFGHNDQPGKGPERETDPRRVAAALDVPAIDLHAASALLCESLGPAGCERLGPRKSDGRVDTTHLNAGGARRIGGLVADLARPAVPGLRPFLTAAAGPVSMAARSTRRRSRAAVRTSISVARRSANRTTYSNLWK